MSKLTDRRIKTARPRAKDDFLSDGLGLYLRVCVNGTKTFVYRYTYAGKRRWVTLGAYPELALADARAMRLEQSKILASGKDPGQIKALATAAKANAMRVEELGERFRQHGMPGYQNPDDAYDRLKRDPIKELKGVLVMDVTPQHITAVFKKMVDRGAKVAANRTLALTKQMFQYAVDVEHAIDTNPVTLRPKAVGGREKSKTTNLLFDQVKEVLAVLNDPAHGLSAETVTGLKLILATAKRPNEVVTAEWSHIDLDRGTWLNPSHLTKEKHGDHLVFLSRYAIANLKTLRQAHPTNKYVLPSPQLKPDDDETHLTRHTLSRAVLRLHNQKILKFKFTPHDLRRTFATRAAELKIAPHVVEKCLDHVMTGMMAVYNHAPYLDDRKRAMEAWGKKLQMLDSQHRHEPVSADRPTRHDRQGRLARRSLWVRSLEDRGTGQEQRVQWCSDGAGALNASSDRQEY